MIKEKVETGVPGLDEMLEGGLIPGRTYMVSGTSGTGKTTLALQFLLEGSKRGERVLYVSLDEPPNEVRRNMMSYGWDLSRIQVFDATADVMSYDKTPVRDVSTERKVVYFGDVKDEIRKTSEKSPMDMTVNTLQELVKQEMKVRRYSRIVIDSLSSLRRFYIRTSEENASTISFIRVLSDIGVTSLVTVQLPEISKPDVEAHMARGEIRLHKWINGRGLMRGVTIEKYRGSSHDHRLRLIKISSEGIVIKSLAAGQTKAEADGADAKQEAAANAPETIAEPPPSNAGAPRPVPDASKPPEGGGP